MAKGKPKFTDTPNVPPALDPDAREAELINLAVNLVEKRLREGTASSQEVTHFLKLASKKQQIENDIMKKQLELIDAKTQTLRSAQRIEDLYANAIDAMRRYSGQGADDHGDYQNIF